MQKNKKKIATESYVIILLVVILIIVFIMIYKTMINSVLHRANLATLSQNVDDCVDDFYCDLQNRINFLRIIARANINLDLDYKKLNSLDDFYMRNYFSEIDIFDLNGISLLDKKNILNKKELESISLNDFCISDVFLENGEKKICVLVRENNLIMRGKCNTRSFDKNLYSSDPDMCIYVINSNGKIVIRHDSPDKNIWYLKDNIFDVYGDQNFICDENFCNLILDLKQNQSGTTEYTYQSVDLIARYKPVGANNWHILCVLPAQTLFSNTNLILLYTVILIFAILILITFMILQVIVSEKNRLNKILDLNNKLEVISDNIPGVIQVRLNDEDFSIKYLSKGFFKITGYNQNEIEKIFKNKYIGLIHENDLLKLKKEISDQERFHVEYRLVAKHKVIWVAERGHMIKNLIYSVIVDISCLKNNLENFEANTERYKLAQNANTILFELNDKSHVTYINKNSERMFGKKIYTQKFPDVISKKCDIPKEDILEIKDIFREINSEKSFHEKEFRIKNKSGKSIWYKMTIKSVFNGQNNFVKAIGKVENINAQKQKQKLLELKSNCDLLTGLYNKFFFKKAVQDYLLNQDIKKKSSALFMIDVDNFKFINDQFGHLVGDEVIIYLASNIKNLFGDENISSRFGGDEFAVFIKKSTSKKFLTECANKLLDKISNSNFEFRVTISIGIALYPTDGKTLTELYNNADAALYQAKRSGKNSFRFFCLEK